MLRKEVYAKHGRRKEFSGGIYDNEKNIPEKSVTTKKNLPKQIYDDEKNSPEGSMTMRNL